MEFKFKSVKVIGVEGFGEREFCRKRKLSHYFNVHQVPRGGKSIVIFLLLIVFTSIFIVHFRAGAKENHH